MWVIFQAWAILRVGAVTKLDGTSPVNARFTLADPTPRLCPDAVGSANVNGFPTRNRLSGPSPGDHREVVGQY